MPNVSDSVMSPAIDSVADWSNDTKARLLAEKERLETMQDEIGANLQSNALSLADADRIADQVTAMRNEMANPTG